MAKRKTQKSTDTQVSAAAETATTVTVPVASEPAPDTSAAVSPASDDSAALSSQPEGGAYSRFSDFDIYLFRSGKHARLYEKFGSHVIDHQGVVGTYFAVWAPSAKYVAVIGNFNGWNKGAHAMGVRWDGSGIWEIFHSAHWPRRSPINISSFTKVAASLKKAIRMPIPGRCRR